MLKTLFSKKAPEAIERLKTVIAENDKADQWRKSFSDQAVANARELQDARDAFSKDPTNPKLLERLNAAYDLKALDERLTAASSLAHEAMLKIKLERSRPALKSALEESITALEAQAEKIRKADKSAADDLGLEPSETESPVLIKISRKLTSARNWLKKLDEPEFSVHSVASVENFLLNE